MKNELKSCCGIYGIWFENELVYIGKTSRNFYRRFLEHKSNMSYGGSILYNEMRVYKKYGGTIICKPLVKFKIGKIADKELRKIEKDYIKKYSPRLNSQK